MRWDRWFLILAIPFGLFFVIAIPPMQEPDAAAHVIRMDQIVRGTLVEPVDKNGQVTLEIDGCLHNFILHHTARGLHDQVLNLAGNWRAIPCGRPAEWGIENEALNTPIPYAAGALGYGTAGLLGGGLNVRYLAARLTGLAVYVLAVWGAIRLAPRGRALLFAVAVLPSSLALAAGLHTDATAIWLAILAVALVLRARERPTHRLLLGLAVVLVALALSKNLYGPYVLLLFLVPAAAFRDARSRRWYVAGVGAVVLLGAGLWATYLSTIHYRLGAPFGIDSKASMHFIVHHPPSFAHAMWNGVWNLSFRHTTLPGFVEVLGGLRQPRVASIAGDRAPLLLFGVAVVVLLLAVFADPGPTRTRDRRSRLQAGLVAASIAAASTLLIFFGQALTANNPGSQTISWIMGRYFLPLVPLAAFASGRRPPKPALVGWAVPAGSLALLGWVSVRILVLFY